MSERQAISVDPTTGRKVFDTRAAPASDRIAGRGYAMVDDERLTAFPDAPAGARFDAEEQARYRVFKEARRGAADYMAMEGEFAKYLADVYSAPPVPREALDAVDHRRPRPARDHRGRDRHVDERAGLGAGP